MRSAGRNLLSQLARRCVGAAERGAEAERCLSSALASLPLSNANVSSHGYATLLRASAVTSGAHLLPQQQVAVSGASGACSPRMFWGSSGQSAFSTAQGEEKSAEAAADAEAKAAAGAEGADQAKDEAEPAAAAAAEGGDEEGESGDEGEATLSAEEVAELRAKCEALEATVAKMGGENADYKDKLIRTLADMENLRERTARQVENSSKFAVQGFVKDLLDVSDNLERALAAVEKDFLDQGEDSKGFQILKSLHEGIAMTETQMLRCFSKHGVERFDPTDQPFDPNLHEARFEVPMPDKEPGTVVVVTKVGYTLHDRVIRPAEVGVVPEST